MAESRWMVTKEAQTTLFYTQRGLEEAWTDNKHLACIFDDQESAESIAARMGGVCTPWRSRFEKNNVIKVDFS